MQMWTRTVLAVATVALWSSGCGKSQETDDAPARAASPAMDRASGEKPSTGSPTTEPVTQNASASGAPAAPGDVVSDAAPAAESLQAAAPTRSSAPPTSSTALPTTSSAPPAAAPVPESAPPTAAAAVPQPGSAGVDVVDPGGEVMVTATKPGLTRLGAAKCQPCHRVQFTSWAETAHAQRTPPLDCEACHGPGSEYKTMAIMKEPVQARSAGLVMPGKEFCATCHKGAWSDDLLRQVHAHKPASP